MAHIPTRHNHVATWLAVAAIILASLAVVVSYWKSDASTGARPAESTLRKVQQAKRIRAAVVPYPPLVVVDPESGAVSGYLIDITDAIAGDAGVEVEYEEATWATMVAGLQTGKYDVVIAGAFRTIPRVAQVAFTDPLMYMGMSAVTSASDPAVVGLADLKQPGLRVAVTGGTAEHEYLTANLPDATPIVTRGPDITPAMLEVISGRADVALVDSVSAQRFAVANPEVRDVFADRPLNVFGAGFMVRHGDWDWLHFLNVAIDSLHVSGRADEFREKYGADANWIGRRLPWE